MLFVSAEDFFAQAKNIPQITREEERLLAQRLGQDPAAREGLIRGYLPYVANYIRRTSKDLQTLQTVYACLDTLEKGVDSFNFQQDGESFSHHLSWRLRQCITRCIADR